MAFTDTIDVTTPPNTEAISNGDDRIRELKRALVEQLATIITGFPNTDPLSVVQTKLFTSVDFVGVGSGAYQSVIVGDPASGEKMWEVFARIINERADKIARCIFVVSGSLASPPTSYIFDEQKGATPNVDFDLVGDTLKVAQTDGAVRTIRVAYRRIL